MLMAIFAKKLVRSRNTWDPPFAGRKFFFPLWPGDGRFRGGRIHSTPPKLWQDYLDAVGIEKAVLYPTLGLSHGLIQEADWACALARAYNTWLHDRFMKADRRLQGVALLPIQDPQEAVKELRRCVRELGMVAGLLPAVTYNRRPYGSPVFHPIFREAEELGCALAIHGSPQSGLGLEVFDRHIEAHVLSHPLPIAMHCISIVLGGVIEKFPKLRVVFLEAGSSWVPFLMERMDFEWSGSNRVSSGAPQRRRQFQKCPASTLRRAISMSAARPRRNLCPGSRSSSALITSYSQPTSRIPSLSSGLSKRFAVLSSAKICR